MCYVRVVTRNQPPKKIYQGRWKKNKILTSKIHLTFLPVTCNYTYTFIYLKDGKEIRQRLACLSEIKLTLQNRSRNLLKSMNPTQQIHVQNNFRLLIPFGGEDDGFDITQHTKPSFGFTITKQDTRESCYYQIQLINIDVENEQEIIIEESLSWAKRNPFHFSTIPNTTVITGLILGLRVNNGLFDFRRTKYRVIRLKVNSFSSGSLINQGISQLCKLLPKKRNAEEDYRPWDSEGILD